MPENIHDKGYKRILSKKKNFLELLKSFIALPWVNQLDESSIEKIDKEFILKDFKEKEADLIYKLKLGGNEIIFYFLMELQSSIDFTMPFRLLLYITELLRQIFMDTPELIREKKEFRLPAVIPCVLYNGGSEWTAVRTFKEYLSGHEELNDYLIDFEYIVLNINKYSMDDLEKIGNLISGIFMLDKKQDPDELKRNLERAGVLVKKLSLEEQNEYMDWLKDVLLKKVSKNNKNNVKDMILYMKEGGVDHMTYGIERLIDEIENQAIEDGKEIGKEENLISQIIKKRMKDYDIKTIADHIEMDEEYVSKVFKILDQHPEYDQNDVLDELMGKNLT